MKKVITYGTFDLLHFGHLNLLKRAKALGDYLIVGVTSDNYDKYRGKLNVSQSTMERVENIRSTGLADEIIVEEYEGQKIDDIVKHNVDIFAIGSDWIGRFDYLNEFCEVVYLERTKGISSTELRCQWHSIIRMGVVGTDAISSSFILESKYVSGLSVEGVYGDSEMDVAAFADEQQLTYFSTDYTDFLDKIDAVYIASSPDTRYQYAKKALLSGKHVLCEKPACLSVNEEEDLTATADSKNLIFMDGMDVAYSPGFIRLISLAKSGKIGEIKSVEATVTRLSPNLQKEKRFGSVIELAATPLFALFRLLGIEYTSANFTSFMKGDVDAFTKIDFLYENAMASVKVGTGVKSEGDLVISGTRGYVIVPSPWWKTEYFELKSEKAEDTEKYFYKFAGDGLRYEIVEFLNRIGGKTPVNKGECRETVAVIEQYLNSERKVIR